MIFLYHTRRDLNSSGLSFYGINKSKVFITENVVTNLQNQIDELREKWPDILRDDTKDAMHLSSSAIPDQAFKYLLMRVNAISQDLAIVTFTVQDQNGNPARQVEIENLIGLDGENVFTDNSGIASGYAAAGSITFKISEYGDIKDDTNAQTLIQGAEYQFDWTVTRRNYLKVTGSRQIRFTPDCPTVSYSLCGGGGGGGRSYIRKASYQYGGGGGGGGYSVIKDNVVVEPGKIYPIAIGGGGSNTGETASLAKSGGTSSFNDTEAAGGSGGENGYSAVLKSNYENSYRSWAAGGSGNGNGGRGATENGQSGSLRWTQNSTSGTSGSGLFYSSYTETVPVGGGGGGGRVNYAPTGPNDGGTPNGGTGGNYSTNSTTGITGEDGAAFGGGGGGGGQHSTDNQSVSGGAGGNGGLGLRMHLLVNI